jgi:general secretion pathway protein D
MKKTMILAVLALFLAACAAPQPRTAPSSAATEQGEKPADVSAEADRSATPSPAVGGGPLWTPPPTPPAPSAPGREAPSLRQIGASGSPAPVRPPGEEKYVSLNFDNADIGLVIQTIAELINLNYIIAPGVSGRITIQSTSKIPVSSLFTVLEELLEVNALTAVKAGDFYKIIPTNQARQKEITTVIEGAGGAPAGNAIITKVIPMTYVRPSEVVAILNPLKSAAGLYLADDRSRLLFLTETKRKIEELMKIVSILDVDSFSRFQVELYPVKYADAEELAQELTQVVTMVFSSAGKGRAVFRIIPAAQINSLMIISGEQGLAGNILSWVERLDQPPTEATDRIFVYPLAHAKAEEIAGVLSQVFKSDVSKTVKRNVPVNPSAPVQQRSRPVPVSARTTAPGISSRLESPVTIVADKSTNTLIIQTSPWYYPVVEETIKKLDLIPRQVLIEVLVAEITLDDETRFGLQWAVRGEAATQVGGKMHNFDTLVRNVNTPGGEGALNPGFSYLLTEANFITAVLSAYANASRLNVLASPHIMAMDNKEASINIGAEVPIVTTQTTETAGGTGLGNTVTNNVEYRDTGVILKVTPHINEGRYVTLDIRQEVSQAQTNILGGTESPIIRNRIAETTMVVKDGQTLVIGGLIEETSNRSREGLPWLSKIPGLGYLFGETVDVMSKKELVLLITPRVVTNPEEGNRVSRKIRDRVLTLKEGIELFTDLPVEEEK